VVAQYRTIKVTVNVDFYWVNLSNS
jgi:hypothetical protein